MIRDLLRTKRYIARTTDYRVISFSVIAEDWTQNASEDGIA
jgi:hypothetical protein